MFGEHLENSRTLMEIHRYQNKFKHKKRTVAEHSWFVTKIAHGLALWERDKFKDYSVNMEKVLFFATNHDIVEGYTGDILSTTKNLSPTLKNELLKVEKVIFEEHLVNTIPASWGKQYIEMNEELAKLETIESKIVKAADLIDRIFECLEEINLGNKYPYETILRKDLDKLYSIEIKSVLYFLKYSIYDLSNAEYYIPPNIKENLSELDFSSYF